MRIVSCFETADPLLNWTRRMRLDAVLLLLFFVVMCDRLTQNPLHEALGAASLLIVCTHLLVNRTWLRQHFGTWFGMEVKRPRRPKAKGRVGTISNIVLFTTFAASFISGVMCSQTLFASVTPQVWRMDLFIERSMCHFPCGSSWLQPFTSDCTRGLSWINGKRL